MPFLKLELTESTLLRQLGVVLIDIIISFRDHFLIKQRITLSETTILFVGLFRVIWPITFGFAPDPPNLILNSPYIVFLFLVLVAGHIVAFFTKDLFYRVAVLCGYAFLWLVLCVFILLTTMSSMLVPYFFVFSLLSTILAVRLMNERTTK